MEFVKKNIKWISLGGCVLAIISLFLPFATVSAEIFGTSISESVTYIEGDGAIVFAAIIVAGVLIFLKKDLFSLIPLGIGTAISIYSAINVGKAFGDVSSLYGDLIKVGFGIGFYLLLVGLVVAAGAMAYSQFVLNKNGGAVSVQPYGQNVQQMPNQGYQSYNYNQPVEPQVQPSYGQPFVGTPVNEVQQPIGMPTSTVDTNIFNQAPVAQTTPVMNNSVSAEQPVMNNVPVQDFSSPATITCPQCRATLNSGMQFCNQCGSKLN